jgi:shikimate dehydrogenase
MNKKIIRLGLIGKDVSKSLSEGMHGFILSQLGYACEYERLSVSPENFDSAIRRLLGDFDGFNVTIPYKRDVMEYLDEIVGDAMEFSAVNTVLSAKRAGYNTDGLGFMLMLRLANIDVVGKRVLVLGAGGAGRSSAAALKKAGAKVYLYQRRRTELLETCNELGVFAAESPETGGYDLLVNCTGVGMHDTEGKSPVTAQAFVGASSAVDLIYAPEKTEFLRLAEEQGLSIVNGKAMLFYQAYFADCLYLGVEPNDAQAVRFYQKYNEQSSKEGVEL